ncbi:MAG: NAD(+) synthase [bacterium]
MRGFARIAAAVPACAVADFAANRAHTLAVWRQAHAEGVNVVVFPELGLCGYSVRDLFLDGLLQEACLESLRLLVEASAELAPLALVGLPLNVRGLGLYNVAAAIQGGRLLGIVPKAYLPTYREFEEARWFRPGAEVPAGETVRLFGADVPFGLDVLFAADGQRDLVVGAEICEDYWVHVPPSVYQVSAGATVICNLSASNFTVGKAELRRLLGQSASDRGKCAYVYVAAGPGESSTDLAFDADAFICENGRILSESKRFLRDDQLLVADVDLEVLVHERLATPTFGDCSRANQKPFRVQSFPASTPPGPLRRAVARHPFLPSDPRTLATRCWEIFEIQSNALATRMQAIGRPRLVLGVSGGLDSTHAALVCAAALDLLGQPRSDLICPTMPGLGTTAGTRTNAERLVEQLGGTFMEIPVSEASRMVLGAVGHPAVDGCDTVEALIDRLRAQPGLADVAVENVQARLRTLVLMTLANQHRGLVVGTGDLSEKALGWSTYSGDHISMYDVNAGVPKTLMQFVIRWAANERIGTWRGDAAVLREVLFAILDTPISPELLPADADGAIAQLTESTIGPYELHDFFLYHLVRHGARPARVLDLARHAFGDAYDAETLRRWCRVFLKRFFQNQFKRSCTADGPKVGMVALSPRGDWRMPSDARVTAWLEAVDAWPG